MTTTTKTVLKQISKLARQAKKEREAGRQEEAAALVETARKLNETLPAL